MTGLFKKKKFIPLLKETVKTDIKLTKINFMLLEVNHLDLICINILIYIKFRSYRNIYIKGQLRRKINLWSNYTLLPSQPLSEICFHDCRM